MAGRSKQVQDLIDLQIVPDGGGVTVDDRHQRYWLARRIQQRPDDTTLGDHPGQLPGRVDNGQQVTVAQEKSFGGLPQADAQVDDRRFIRTNQIDHSALFHHQTFECQRTRLARRSDPQPSCTAARRLPVSWPLDQVTDIGD